MRAVFVSHLHPEEQVVGATRLREFAQAMARRGHQVVLLTASREGIAGDRPEDLPDRLERHDWSSPLWLAAPPRSAPLLNALRQGTLPRPLRWALIAGLYLGRGGVFPDWSGGAAPFLPILARTFRPQVTWGTFGNTDAWLIARRVARLSGCPWVMDIKDKWDTFIPGPFRRALAQRFSDAAAMTALAQSYQSHSRKRFSLPSQVVYSGVPSTLLRTGAEGAAEARITLSGSIYSPATLDALLRGIEGLGRSDITFTYVGADHRQVRNAAASLTCRQDIRPIVPLEELAALQRSSFANLYCCVGDHDRFHHKLFEMLCADRPIICLPPDGSEAVGLAAELNGALHCCGTPEEVTAALAEAWSRRDRPVDTDRHRLEAYGWDGQAGILEWVLTAAAEGSRP